MTTADGANRLPGGPNLAPISPDPPPRTALLEISGLTHRYGDRIAVEGLDATVEAGEIVGLVGRNGAGKTTTMRAVMGILRPTAGTIRWRGRPMQPDDRLRFGYMPEERGLYPQMKIREQIAYFGELHGVDRATATARADGWLATLDLKGREEERVIALSHGNQQRVQLAVALVHDPELLVLDEPFAGLDPSAIESLSGILRDLATSGKGVIFSSHQLDLVERLCDRVVLLESGRLLATGTLDELRQRLPRRLRVHVAGLPHWAPDLPSVARVDDVPGGGVLLTLPPSGEVDPQAVLRAAQAEGPVESFGFEAPSLVDVYRHLVSP